MSVGNDAGGDKLPSLERRRAALLGEQRDEVLERFQRTVEYIRADAAVDKRFAPVELYLHGRQQCFHIARERHWRTDDQLAMQPIVRRGIWQREFPGWMVALHDLDGMRYPPDALDEVALIRRGAQPEADLGLDSRIDEPGERDACTVTGGADKRAVIDGPPNGLVDAVARPDGTVGEADLAADAPP